MQRTRTIHLWAPDLWRTRGGIQAYLLGVIRALQELYPETRIIVLSMSDCYVPEGFPVESHTEFHCVGSTNVVWSRIRFCLKALMQSVFHRPAFLLVGHVHFCSVAYLLHLLLRIPYYSFGYGLDVWGERSRFFQRSLMSSRKVISISGYTARRIHSDQNVPEDRITLLPCTLDATRFIPKPKPAYLAERYQIGPQHQVILMVCRLASVERYKGYDILLEAIPRLLPSFPNLRFLIAGKGADFPRVSARITAMGLSEQVKLLGFIPDGELCDLYNLCDVFAMPSKGEGFGIVFLEALACGKPVLAGNQDGSAEAVLHGRLGCLVNPDSHEEIKETLQQLLTGRHPNASLRDAGFLRQGVIDAFGHERFVQTLRQILQ